MVKQTRKEEKGADSERVSQAPDPNLLVQIMFEIESLKGFYKRTLRNN